MGQEDDRGVKFDGGEEAEMIQEFTESLDEDERLAAEALLAKRSSAESSDLEIPKLGQRSRSAPSLLASLTKSLAAEREARRETEAKLKSEVEREREARLEAEDRGQRSALIVSALSPFESKALAWFAKKTESIRCPRTVCCCCGPCSWIFLILISITYVFVTSSSQFEDTKLLLSSQIDWSEIKKNNPYTGVSDEVKTSRKISRRPAYRFLERATPGARDCVQAEYLPSEEMNHTDKENTKERNHPVVIIPGMTSTALEVWRGIGCYEDATRQRVWSSRGSTTTFLLDPECLQRHLLMNPKTWDDPDDIRVRAASGLSAADAFGPLNLWGEFIVNLAMLGYDETSIAVAAFDWRLDPTRLERRDAYFTRLQRTIEVLVETNCGSKVTLIAHSLGGNHAFYFFNWVEHRQEGWVEKYVDALSFVGGSLLGAPKALPYLISGEMTDAFQIGEIFSRLNEMHGGISRDSLFNLAKTWGSVPSLLPRGGNTFWSLPPAPISKTSIFTDTSPDDDESTENMQNLPRKDAYKLVELADPRNQSITAHYLDADESMDFLRTISPEYMQLVDEEYDLTAGDGSDRSADPRAWSNVLLTPLPIAPSLKIYCFYGVGRPTPKTVRFVPIKDTCAPAAENETRSKATTLDEFVKEHNLNVSTDTRKFELSRINGLLHEDGDGTVPLLSLGYMCAEGWKSKKLNPARIPVIIKEYLHRELSPRDAVTRPLELIQGLANERDADHVTILANREMIGDLLDVSLGQTKLQKSSMYSEICKLSAQVDFIQDALDDSAVAACSTTAAPAATNHPSNDDDDDDDEY